MPDAQGKIRFYVGVIIIIVSLYIFEYVGLAIFFTNILGRAIRPMRIMAGSGINFIEKPFFTIKKSVNAARRVQMLEVGYSEVLAQLSEFKGLEAENRELKGLLENTDRQTREVIITAPVVSQIGPSVGVGSKNGVEVGDLVFIAQTLVGRISAVDENFSQVSLIYDKDFQSLAVENDEGVKGIVRGDGKNVVFTEVMPEQNPSQESRLVTLGQTDVEKDLFVGQVGKLISNASDPVKTYQVLRLVDFNQARIVEIYK